MARWNRIIFTSLFVILLFLLLTVGNGLAANSKIRIPGLGILLGISIPFVIRYIWRSKPRKVQQGQGEANLEPENIEREMTFPEKLRINRMEDYHTHYLGKTIDGRLFWGYETFAYSPPFAQIRDENTWQYRSDYAVLHLFNTDGDYQSSKSFSHGKGILPKGAVLTDKLEEWVAELGEITYCDIEIKLFQTTIDGFTFGLIPDSEYSMIDLEPSSTISFQEPWDGEYYT